MSAAPTPSKRWRRATTSTSSSWGPAESSASGRSSPPCGPARSSRRPTRRRSSPAATSSCPSPGAAPRRRGRRDPRDPYASPLAWLRPIDSEHSAIWQCLSGEPMAGRRRAHPDRLGRPVPRRDPRRARRRRRRPQALRHPTWTHGRQDHDRLRDARQQGPGGHRGTLAVRCRLRRHRGRHPPAERRPLGRPLRGRIPQGPAGHPRHETPHPVRADLPRPPAVAGRAARPRSRPARSTSARPTRAASRPSGSPARRDGWGRGHRRHSSPPTRSQSRASSTARLVHRHPGLLEAAVARFGGTPATRARRRATSSTSTPRSAPPSPPTRFGAHRLTSALPVGHHDRPVHPHPRRARDHPRARPLRDRPRLPASASSSSASGSRRAPRSSPTSGETVYTLNWLPIGGFVKLEGEDGTDADDPRSFSSQRLPLKLLDPRRRRRDEHRSWRS